MPKGSKKKIKTTEEFSSYDELVRVLSEIDSVIFEEETDLRRGVRAISNILQIIENMLLRVFFTNYQQWFKEAREAEVNNEPPPPIPSDLIQVGARVHKLITDRGKFILEILKGKLDQTEGEKETQETYLDLLKMPSEEDFDLEED